MAVLHAFKNVKSVLMEISKATHNYFPIRISKSGMMIYKKEKKDK